MKAEMLSSDQDMDWLWTTHLKPFVGTRKEYKSAIVYGNEDCPERIELFKQVDPHYKTKPSAVFLLQKEDLTYKKEEINEKTKVVFRVWNDGGTVIALFPEVDEGNGYCSSYEHVGQHSGADYKGVVARTRLASPKEYQFLLRELRGIGYDLEIRKRWNRRFTVKK